MIEGAMHVTRRLPVAIAAALVLAACGTGRSGDASPSAPPPPDASRPSSTARLEIARPRPGLVVRGPAVELRIRLEGARIVPLTTTDLAPDEGHLHVTIDDELVSMTEGLRQTIPDVEPGTHRITVEFVAADHAPFDPRVVVVTVFEVAP
jgi:hypothetical protein